MNMKDVSKDDLLNAVGLRTKGTDWLSGVGIFGAGLLVGVGIRAFLKSPAGQEFYSGMKEKVGGISEQAKSSFSNTDSVGQSASMPS